MLRASSARRMPGPDAAAGAAGARAVIHKSLQLLRCPPGPSHCGSVHAGRVDEVLMSIGGFARLCRLSVKQLRHYDDLGLLRPAQVDPDSGYRYYRADQARDALSIGLLRSLDVPLP